MKPSFNKRIWTILRLALPAVFVMIGCTETAEPPVRGASIEEPYDGVPFIRLIDLMPESEAPREPIARIGAEYRAVLSFPYRSPLDTDSGITTLVNVEDMSPNAVGIALACKTQASVAYGFIPVDRLRRTNNQTQIRDVFSAILSTPNVEASVWAREVVPHREHVLRVREVPPAARLAFGIGMEESLSDTPMPVRFIVSVDRGGNRTVLFDETLQPQSLVEADKTTWQDVVVDVSEFAGQDVSFSFATETATANAASAQIDTASPLWADPIIYTTLPISERTSPNLLLVSLDTLRADHLGCYGYGRETSPNLDQFAEECYLFEQCIAPSSWTTPSHATAFTGIHPSIHGAGGFTRYRLHNRFTTIAEIAQQEDHLTAAYTEGVAVGGQLGFYQGFDRYSNGAGTRPSPPGTSKRTFADAASWLEQFGHLPFVMFVHTYEIHWPYEAPPPFDQLFEPDAEPLTQLAGSGATPAQRQKVINAYDRGIAFTDSVWGDFQKRLREMGLLENTVVIVFADHGEAFWEHGGSSHGRMLYQEVLHVPFLIRLPGANPPHGRIDRLISLADTFGTAIDLLGLNHPAPADCYSLRTLMNHSTSTSAYPRMSVSSALNQRTLKTLMLSFQTADSKYIATTNYNNEQSPIHDFLTSTTTDTVAAQERATIAHLIGGGRDFWNAGSDEARNEMFRSAREELFDAATDPQERRDLVILPEEEFDALGVPNKLHESRTALLDHLSVLAQDDDGEPDMANDTSPLTDEEREELGALGYVLD